MLCILIINYDHSNIVKLGDQSYWCVCAIRTFLTRSQFRITHHDFAWQVLLSAMLVLLELGWSCRSNYCYIVNHIWLLLSFAKPKPVQVWIQFRSLVWVVSIHLKIMLDLNSSFFV